MSLPHVLLCVLPALTHGLELDFAADVRLRFETIEQNPRLGREHDDLLLARTQVRLLGTHGRHAATIEMVDSRQWFADKDTPLNTGMVNARELKQLFVNLRFDTVEVALGRMTREDGTRRFLARNRFRNTTNTFNGVDLTIKRSFGTLRSFYLKPTRDRPNTPSELRANRYAADGLQHGQTFWGIEYAGESKGTAKEEGSILWRLGFFALDERDRDNRPSRDRQVHTLSGMATWPDGWRNWTLSWNGALQWGRMSSGLGREAPRLDHRAYFSRVSAKRALSDVLDLTVSLDYASGDEDPLDSSSERFDTLFGVQRFEWGPGSLYGAFRRSNVISPGIRLDFRRRELRGDLTYRPVWLAARRDVWAGVGLRDPTGRSGRFLGHQLDGRVRFKAKDWLDLELGAALLDHGSFARQPRRGEDSVTSYGYVQMTARF